MTKPFFSSKIILGACPSAATIASLIARGVVSSTHQDDVVSMSVFQVRIDGTTRYACWAGGHMAPPPDGKGAPLPHLTPVGAAAVEALSLLPPVLAVARHCALVFQEVKLGKTPLARKFAASFRMSADVNALLVFVGDLAGELDGHMGPAFNVIDAIDLAECGPMTLSGNAVQLARQA